MQKYFNSVANAQGKPVQLASVLVQNYPAGTTATIYSDNNLKALANPLTTDANGQFAFYAADGRYQLVISGYNIVTQTIPDILLEDPTDGGSAGNFSSLVVATTATVGGSAVATSATLAASSASSGIGFIQSGTGAVARTAQDKLRDVVSVKDFGAKGDGTTDDTAAIQAAITAVGQAGGGAVYFPAGTYKVGSQLTVSSSGIFIRGAGIQSTTINSSSTTASVFSFSGPQNQGISDLSITYSGAQTAGAAVSVSNVRNFAMDRVKISGAYQGVNIAGGVIQYYTNLEIINSVNAAIYINGGNDQFLKNIVADAPAGSQPVAGIRINKTDAVWIDSVDMIHQGTGLLVDPQAATDYISWLFVSNSAFDTGSGNGISLAPANAAAVIKGSTFTGSWTSSNSNFGVNIDGPGTVDGVRFVGHRSFNNGLSGYVITASSTHTNISFNNCDAAGNSTANLNTYSGFDIGAGVSGFSITNSRSGAEAGFSSSQSRGILINPGASTNYLLMGNDVRGNTNASILDLGTGNAKIVKGNLGYNPIANTAITVGASPFTYTNNTGDTVNVFISGGTVSSVTLGGNTVAGATNTVIPVQQGGSLVVTYTAAPTMTYSGV